MRRAALAVGSFAAAGAVSIPLFCLKSVQPGHRGYTNLFGNVSNKKYDPGLHFINPFADMVRLDIRKQAWNYKLNVNSKEGLGVEVSSTCLFSQKPEYCRDIYVNVGDDYVYVLVHPQFKAITRNIVSGYDAKALYNEETRVQIKQKIMAELHKLVSETGIEIHDVLIDKIKLPEHLTKSIEEKLRAEQEMQRMDFIVEKEQKEAKRKEIEAEGIKTFQDIVSEGISAPLLSWKGIEATRELATSNNAKVVVIGNSENGGLPLIFNTTE